MNNRLRTVHLEGQLKEVCGGNSTVQLVGDSIPVLISGLTSMFGEKVKEVVKHNNWHVYLNEDKEGADIGEGQINHHLLDTNDVFIFPAVEGSGRVGQVILGVIMIVIGLIIIFGSSGTGVAPGSAVFWEGVLLITAGALNIYTALTTPKAQEQRAAPEERASFIFNGATNVVEQGGAVPCVYGRFRVGSTVVSAGIDTSQFTGGWIPGGPGGGGGLGGGGGGGGGSNYHSPYDQNNWDDVDVIYV